MKELEYGKGYQYAHDFAEKLTDMQCLPDSLLGREYYHPTEEGAEAKFAARLADIKAWKRAHAPKKGAASRKSAAQKNGEAGADVSENSAPSAVPEKGAKAENADAAAPEKE